MCVRVFRGGVALSGRANEVGQVGRCCLDYVRYQIGGCGGIKAFQCLREKWHLIHAYNCGPDSGDGKKGTEAGRRCMCGHPVHTCLCLCACMNLPELVCVFFFLTTIFQ